jgi:hypothetical protein
MRKSQGLIHFSGNTNTHSNPYIPTQKYDTATQDFASKKTQKHVQNAKLQQKISLSTSNIKSQL